MNKIDALSFNKNIESYIIARPGYPDRVYDLIDKTKKLDYNSRILELGCGNGIATKEIIKKWDPYILGIEPGKELYRKLKNDLIDNNKVEIKNTLYEEYEDTEKFDAIFSATAFHWMDKNYKYIRSYELLKDDGVLVLYWNNFGINDRDVENAIDTFYIETGFEQKRKSTIELQNEKINERYVEVNSSDYFFVIKQEVVENLLSYSVDRYIELLKTFSDHSIEKKPRINEMYRKIRNELVKHNDKIDLKIRINLIIAKKT